MATMKVLTKKLVDHPLSQFAIPPISGRKLSVTVIFLLTWFPLIRSLKDRFRLSIPMKLSPFIADFCRFAAKRHIITELPMKLSPFIECLSTDTGAHSVLNECRNMQIPEHKNKVQSKKSPQRISSRGEMPEISLWYNCLVYFMFKQIS